MSRQHFFFDWRERDVIISVNLTSFLPWDYTEELWWMEWYNFYNWGFDLWILMLGYIRFTAKERACGQEIKQIAKESKVRPKKHVNLSDEKRNRNKSMNGKYTSHMNIVICLDHVTWEPLSFFPFNFWEIVKISSIELRYSNIKCIIKENNSKHMVPGDSLKPASLWKYGLICTASLWHYQRTQYCLTVFISLQTIIKAECNWMTVKVENGIFQSQISQENQDFKVSK